MSSPNICIRYASRRICKLVFILQYDSYWPLFTITPFYALRNAEVKRITNQDEYAAGEPFLSTITIKRSFPFPLLYLIIEDELPSQFTNCKQTKMNKVILFSRIETKYFVSICNRHNP